MVENGLEPTLDNLETVADTWGFVYGFEALPGRGVRLSVVDVACWPGLEVQR